MYHSSQLLSLWVQRGQTRFWHAEHENAGGCVNLVSLCGVDHSRPAAVADTAWPLWPVWFSSAKPNSRHTMLVSVTNTAASDSTQALTAQHSRSKRTSHWGQGRSQTLAFTKNSSEKAVTVFNILANVAGVYKGQAFFFGDVDLYLAKAKRHQQPSLLNSSNA